MSSIRSTSQTSRTPSRNHAPSSQTPQSQSRPTRSFMRSDTHDGPLTTSPQQADFSPNTEGNREHRRGLLILADRYLSKNSGQTKRWVEKFGKFDVVGEVVLKGFALHAVEAWVVDRSRLTSLLVSVTGDPADHVVTYLLSPREDLSQVESTQEIEKAVKKLRRDRARPIETEQGVLMVTSVASLSHDINTIPIPGGDYRKYQEDLYVKLDVKRFGCGGRSNLTIDPPSMAVQYKFLSQYRLPPPSDRNTFNMSVLELVKLIQIALYHHGLFGREHGEVPDGLLCEGTMQGLVQWLRDMNSDDPRLLELDRNDVLDSQGPSLVAALFSVITSVRCKLIALDIEKVPTDPFVKLKDFRICLGLFQRIYQHHRDVLEAQLSSQLISQVTAIYQREQNLDSKRLTRKLRHQVSAAGAGIASNVLHFGHRKDEETAQNEDEDGGKLISASNSYDTLSPDAATTHLDVFVRAINANVKDKDGFATGRIRALWTGRISRQPDPPEWRSLGTYDPEIIDLEDVEDGLMPGKAREGSRFRSGEKREKGTIRGVTARTGLALKDGITGWAKRGTLFGETSDSDSPYGGREPPSSHEDYWKGSRKAPKLVLPQSDIEEMSNKSTPQPSGRDKSSEPQPEDKGLGGFLGYTLPRPGIVGNQSYSGSDAWGPSVSDANLSETSPREPANHIPEAGPSQNAAAFFRHHSVSVLPLVRTVSFGARAAIDHTGMEYVHEGHGLLTVEAHIQPKASLAARKRSWSFHTLSEIPAINVLPKDMIAIDVGLCSAIWQMTDRLKYLKGSVVSLQALEKAMYEVAAAYVNEIQARRMTLERTVKAIQELSGGPSQPAQLPTEAGTSPTLPSTSGNLTSTRRADRDVEEKQKRLHYSLMDLDRTLASLDYTRGAWEGFLKEYGLAEKEDREMIKITETETASTWTSLHWLKRWTPRSG